MKWTVAPRVDPDNLPYDFPTLGPAFERRDWLIQLMGRWLATCPPIKRLAFAGNLLAAETVRVHVAEARKFVETSAESWDLVHVSLLDSFSASAAGALSLSESTLYTIEAFDAFLSRLAEGGMLAITRWLRVPPRDSLKLLATAADALALRGEDDPGRRLALIRGQTTSTLVIKNGRLSQADIAAIRRFSAARGFDLAWYPGMQPDEANRYSRLHGLAPCFQQPGRFSKADCACSGQSGIFAQRMAGNKFGCFGKRNALFLLQDPHGGE